MSIADGTHEDVTDSTTFAMRPSSDRRADAVQQPRDKFGRWITEGASVQWRENDRDYAGTILEVKKGQAIVSVKNGPDEKPSTVVLAPKALKVTSSKATLDYKDIPAQKSETAKSSIGTSAFKEQLETEGIVSVKRNDGYRIEAIKQADVGGNPILYKLYAPNGRSLGEYDEKAVDNFEKMIAEDKAMGPRTTDENGDVIPMSPDTLIPAGGPVAASASVVRIARDGTAIIVEDNSVFKLIDIASGFTAIEASNLDALLPASTWRKTVGKEKELSTHLVTHNDAEIEITTLAQYRVPNAVKEAITASLDAATDLELTEEDQLHIKSLAHDDLVSLDSINWINKFFADREKPENIHGGYAGKKWAAKILNKTEDKDDLKNSSDESCYSNFDDDTFVYLGIGHDVENGTTISELFSVDLETDAVYRWNQGEFSLQKATLEEVDAPIIVVIDAVTAQTIARWIDVASSTPVMDILDVDPEERNLFTLAESELDFEEMDRAFAIIADATGYTPVERSVNAQRQKRGPGGKFGGEQVPQSSTLTEGVTKKASLPAELPLVENVGELIQAWLETAEDFTSPSADAVMASASEFKDYSSEQREKDSDRGFALPNGSFPIRTVQDLKNAIKAYGRAKEEDRAKVRRHIRKRANALKHPELIPSSWSETSILEADIALLAAGMGGTVIDLEAEGTAEADVPAEETPAAEEPAQEAPAVEAPANENILYFAIVDPVDKTAVVDAVALIKQNNNPVAWVRSGGTWVKSPEKLSDLQGATPPPVVKLDVPEPVKTVLSQIDGYDQEKGVKTEEMPIAASGFSLFDNTLSIFKPSDIVKSVFTISELEESEYLVFAKQHIRKRAKALNRMDLVPLEWREASLVEIGIIETHKTPLFGEFGEIITASGVPGIADTPGDFKNTERLMNYWAFGKGAAKIRWGTPGDLTRAHRHLVKYVGPMRAWGLAQNLHKRVMGVPNITHDRATGQYRGRGRK
jgi:hypothetical protein